MRLLWVLLLGCTTNAPCRPGTVLLDLSLPDGTKSIHLSIDINGDTQTFDRDTSNTHETIEIDFAQYPHGAITVDVVTDSGVLGHADKTLDAGCTVVPISFIFDLGSGGDAVKPTGAPCGDADVCSSGTCVDGRCCELPCTGKCEACDVPDMEGHCVAVSGPLHGNRTCPGDQFAPCQGYCNGVDRSICTFGNDPCSDPSCAAGVATLPKQCDNGTCPSGAADQQTCRIGCDGNSCLGVVSLSAGDAFACAALTDGTVRCWGINNQHQLGQGASTSTSLVPLPVAGLANVKQLASNFSSTCALLGDGTVSCWGTTGGASPSPMPGIQGATFLGGSSNSTYCAIVAGGELRCWGDNTYGELGIGTVGGAQASPVPVCAPGSTSLPCANATGAVDVRTGDTHACAVFSGGSVACWGDNSFGQLGLPASANPSPFPIVVGGLNAGSITAGNYISCATSSGNVYCWGAKSASLLGSNQMTPGLALPTAVCDDPNCSTRLDNVSQVVTAFQTVCALSNDSVLCWGDNGYDQLGDGSTSTTRPSQSYAATVSVASGAVAVVAGYQSNYAIIRDRADSYVIGWGNDGTGELGDNTTLAMPSPSPVEPKW